jgi:hypothetical protein
VLVDVGDRAREGLHDLFVQRSQHLLELASGVAHVAHLGVEVLVAVLERRELLEGERVDRTERGDARLELADALFEGHSARQLHRGSRAQLVGLDAEVPTHYFVEVGDLDDELGLLNLGLALDVAELDQPLVGGVARSAHLLEPFGAGSRGLERLTIGRVHRLLRDADLVGGAFDERGQSTQHLQVELERHASTGRLGPLARASLEPLLDLALALLDQTTALAELGLTRGEFRRPVGDAPSLSVEL